MANSFIKPTVIVKTALGLLQRDIVLPGLVWLNGVGDFKGAYNDTLSLRVPARTAARSRALRATGGGRNITTDTLSQTKVDVTLSTDIYNAVPVTDEELSLDIETFGADILAPQVRAVAEGIENALVVEMQSASYDTVISLDPADPYSGLVDARKALNDANVPMAGRAVAVGSTIEAAMLKADLFKRVDQSGASADAVRMEGYLGRVAGFDIVASNALNPDEAFAFHKTAFVLATRAPAVPDGASFGASETYAGLSMRWLRDYDFTTTTDRSLVDCYIGTKTVTDTVNSTAHVVRAVRIELIPTSIAVSPATVTKAVAQTQQLTVTATYADGTTRDVTAISTYATSNAARATVSTAGLITAVATGSAATITATFAGRTSTCAFTVS